MAKKKSSSKAAHAPKGWSIAESSSADERDFVGKADAVGQTLSYIKEKSAKHGRSAMMSAADSPARIIQDTLVQKKLIANNADSLGSAVSSKSGIFNQKGKMIGTNG